MILWMNAFRGVSTKRVQDRLHCHVIILLIAADVAAFFTIVEMFKFDFVQDGNGERAQTVQNEKGEPTEPFLTEISLIELVRGPAIKLTGNCDLGPLHSWTHCPPLFPSPRCKYHPRETIQKFLSPVGTSSTRDFN